MKKYKKIKQNKVIASEPPAAYGKKNIRHFNSFEEMNDVDIREMAAFSPAERFMHITELLKLLFSKELSRKFSDYTIHYK